MPGQHVLGEKQQKEGACCAHKQRIDDKAGIASRGQEIVRGWSLGVFGAKISMRSSVEIAAS